MQIRQLSLVAAISALTFTTTTNAVLGPIPIYLNTEYRTENPVIGSIASTLSFNAEDIRMTGANTFIDFLATVPSVGIFNPMGNIPAIFMRGGHSNHTLVLLDGVSINSASSLNGAVEYGLSTIALNDIEKIEIVKNSGSVLYGSSAVSGVINIITKKGLERENMSFSTKIGTHNSKTHDLSASISDNEGNFIRFSHNLYTTNGINARTDDTSEEKDGIDNQTTLVKVGNQYFDFSVSKSVNKSEYDDGANDDVEILVGSNELDKVTANVYHKFNDNWKTSTSITQIKSRRDESVSGVTTIGNTYKRTNLTLLNNLKVGGAIMTVGLSAVDDENTTSNLKHSSKDVFIDWQKNINNLDLNAGFRHINHNKFSDHIIYNSGLAKYLDNNLKLTANYNTAFRAPSLKEVTSGTQTNALKPETSKNINLGLSQGFTWGEASLSLFKSQTKDRITYASSWPNSVYENLNTYDTKGIELSISTLIAGHSVNLDHTHSKSSDNNSGSDPVRRPRNISNLTISKQYGKFNSRMQVIKKSASKDTANLPGYALLNLSTNYTINENTQATFTLKNAADKAYTTADTLNGFNYNTLGRALEAGVTYHF